MPLCRLLLLFRLRLLAAMRDADRLLFLGAEEALHIPRLPLFRLFLLPPAPALSGNSLLLLDVRSYFGSQSRLHTHTHAHTQ